MEGIAAAVAAIVGAGLASSFLRDPTVLVETMATPVNLAELGGATAAHAASSALVWDCCQGVNPRPCSCSTAEMVTLPLRAGEADGVCTSSVDRGNSMIYAGSACSS